MNEEVIAVLSVDLFRDVDRLANQLLVGQPGSARAPREMPIDLYRLGDHYVLHADFPGVDPGSIDVRVENQVLTVTAERTPATDEGVQWIGSERPTGRFARRLTLGASVDTDAITATYTDGVLTVTLPIADRAKARRIDVTTTQAAAEEQPLRASINA